MSLVQRIVESTVLLPMAGFTLAARGAQDRIYLGFSANNAGANLAASTKPGATPANAWIVSTGNPGTPRWELFKATHGQLVRQEWFLASAGGLGNITVTVLELYEEETGFKRSAGGILLPGDGSVGGILNGSGLDPATIRIREITHAKERLRREVSCRQLGQLQ